MSVGLYLHAVRAARPRQIERRLTRPLRRRLVPGAADAGPPAPLEELVPFWRSAAFARAEGSHPGGRLAGFAAAYNGSVLEAARAGDAARAAALLDDARGGDRWHPYVVSTRILNWVAALSLAPALATAGVGESLRRQLAFLRRNVEDDVLGNHVLRNATALLLGGVSVGDDSSVRLGRLLFARELPEQVLPDGGHYERSPAYHRLVLRDLLQAAPYADVQRAVAAMTGFAVLSSRPDGAPWLFNDGGADVAPALELEAPADGLSLARDTGYAFLRRPGLSLAFDCGPPAPEFLPAHAHADALSFQLWLDGAPAVVDPGTSTYEPGERRAWERGTRAHSTVAVDGDQFRLWGAFRSGPLPAVRLTHADSSTVAGEVLLRGGVVHRRTIALGERSLLVEDRVEGEGRHTIVSSLPVAQGSPLRVEPLAGSAEEEPATYAERFGETRGARAHVVRVDALLPWEGGWRLSWGAP